VYPANNLHFDTNEWYEATENNNIDQPLQLAVYIVHVFLTSSQGAILNQDVKVKVMIMHSS
jgi:hypothetical protein